MQKKALLLVNPNAGRKTIRTKLLEVIYVLKHGGYDTVTYPTEFAGEIPSYLKEELCRSRYDLVVTVGGDGTLNETITGLLNAESTVPLGYIPAGTVNDFAVAHGIPRDTMKAADKIVHGVPTPCDVARFGTDRYFTYVAAFGVFTGVSYQTPQQSKNLLGRTAYFLEALKELPGVHDFDVEIEADGVYLHDRYIYGMISNTLTVGGVLKLKEKQRVELDDGLHEVLLIRAPKNLGELHEIVNSLLRNDFSNEYIVTFKTAELRVKTEETLTWSLDGEYGGATTDVRIKNLHKALNLIA